MTYVAAIAAVYALIAIVVSVAAPLVDRRRAHWSWEDAVAYGLPGLFWPFTAWVIWSAYRKQR